MLIQNGVVHPMDAPVIPRGFVLLEGDKIAAVGPMEALPAGYSGEVLDAEGGTSSPASSTPTATWACSETPWALRPTTATSPPTPAPPSCGPSTG